MATTDLDTTLQIRSFIRENLMYGEYEVTLSDQDSLLETGLIDSTGVLELVAYLEQTFDVLVDDSELVPENLDSVASIVAFVARKRGLVESRP